MAKKFIQIDGASGYVTIPDAAALRVGAGNFSFSIWVCWLAFPAVGQAPPILIKSGVGGYEWELYFQQDGDDYLLCQTNGTETIAATMPSPLQLNTWYHIVASVVRVGGGSKIYVNNVCLDVTGSVSSTNYENDGAVLINTDAAGEQIIQIDDFRLYKKALSAAEVAAIYNAGTPKPYSVFDAGAAAAAFNIDESSGTTITDEIGGLVGTFSATGVAWGLGDPGTAVIEQIAAEIETAINEITVANGFNQTLTAIRPRRLDFVGILLNDGKVFIWQGDHNAVENPASMAAEWLVEFSIGALIIDSDAETDSIDTRLNDVAADILKKLKEDHTRGGFAIDTLFPSIAKIDTEEVSGVIVTITVHYRTQYADPYTLI